MFLILPYMFCKYIIKKLQKQRKQKNEGRFRHTWHYPNAKYDRDGNRYHFLHTEKEIEQAKNTRSVPRKHRCKNGLNCDFLYTRDGNQCHFLHSKEEIQDSRNILEISNQAVSQEWSKQRIACGNPLLDEEENNLLEGWKEVLRKLDK